MAADAKALDPVMGEAVIEMVKHPTAGHLVRIAMGGGEAVMSPSDARELASGIAWMAHVAECDECRQAVLADAPAPHAETVR